MQTRRWPANAGSRLKPDAVLGRPRPKGQPSSRTGENSPYGMIGGDRGNVGIIRSPVRASILPDLSVMSVYGLIWRAGMSAPPSALGTESRPDVLNLSLSGVLREGCKY